MRQKNIQSKDTNGVQKGARHEMVDTKSNDSTSQHNEHDHGNSPKIIKLDAYPV